ncbi:MAG: hypothetical protein K2K00_06725 [Muribaculaceae bacterium]|nr:hypothetical protein [Muribaculaceae bacterium]
MKSFRTSVFCIIIVIMCPLDTYAYYPMSPYSYCCGDPVNNIDPTGCVIEGVSKKDAALAVEDFRAMFSGDEFSNFRNLIVQSGKRQNGKSFAPISQNALSAALKGVSLNEDQQALVDMVVNTINSDDVHTVEYQSSDGVLSSKGEKAFLPGYMEGGISGHMSQIMERNGGLPLWLIMTDGGSGATVHTKNGSHSVIVVDGIHPNGRAVTTGHEILGHGRSWSAGYQANFQHVEPIRTENLILRVMGVPFINTGIDHGPKTLVPQPTLLPAFR